MTKQPKDRERYRLHEGGSDAGKTKEELAAEQVKRIERLRRVAVENGVCRDDLQRLIRRCAEGEMYQLLDWLRVLRDLKAKVPAIIRRFERDHRELHEVFRAGTGHDCPACRSEDVADRRCSARPTRVLVLHAQLLRELHRLVERGLDGKQFEGGERVIREALQVTYRSSKRWTSPLPTGWAYPETVLFLRERFRPKFGFPDIALLLLEHEHGERLRRGIPIPREEWDAKTVAVRTAATKARHTPGVLRAVLLESEKATKAKRPSMTRISRSKNAAPPRGRRRKHQ